LIDADVSHENVPVETLSAGNIDPWWVTGFCDGEASFTYSRSSRQIALYFAVKLIASDRPVLERLQAYFGCGSLYHVAPTPARNHNSGFSKTATLFRVTRHDDLPRVTDHFDQYPLQSQKLQAYKIWKGMVEIKRLFRGRNREALQELALALSAIQPRNQSWR
jgi:hypothetical protein